MKGVLKKLEDISIRWEDQPASYRFGSFVKKKLIKFEALNRKSGQMEKVTRTQMVIKPIELGGFSEENRKLLFAKHWPEKFLDGGFEEIVVPRPHDVD